MKRAYGLLLWLVASSAYAQAGARCELLSTPGVAYPTYSVLGGTLDGEAELVLSCTPDPLVGGEVPFRLSASPGSSNNFQVRWFNVHGERLRYNLYLDPARTQVWGDGSSGTTLKTGTCSGVCSVTIYGRIFAGQSVAAGTFYDDVAVTLDF